MDLRARVGASAVLALLLLSGCAAPDAEPRGALTVAPGTTAHLLLALGASGDADVELSVHDDAGLNVTIPTQLHANATGVAGWLGIQAPADAEPGEREVVLDVRGGQAQRVSVTVTVASPEPLGEGAVALVDLTFRTRDGAVANTNREAVVDSPLSRTADYRPPEETEPFPVLLSPQQLPPQLLGPLAAAAVGHSLTIEMPDFYGPVSQEEEVDRTEEVPRTRDEQRYVEMPRAQAEQAGFVTAETEVGDALPVGGPVPYVVETLDDETFRAEVDLREGDRLTLHPAWPDATVVEARGAETVTLRTEPPVAEGERFTWNPDWPEATEVASVEGDVILLRHSPAKGTTYTTTTQQGASVETTVVAVGPETITISRANPHPLAGRTVFIELTVVGEEEPPQQPTPGAPPGP